MLPMTYPGVYVQELPSGVHTITGVSTSNTGFVDYFPRGPLNEPVRISSLADFNRIFGGLDEQSEASYAILQYFLNGGQTAWVVRVAPTPGQDSSPPAGDVPQAAGLILKRSSHPGDVLNVSAKNPGSWGDYLYVSIDIPPIQSPPQNAIFNLHVREQIGTQIVNSEDYYSLTTDQKQVKNYAPGLINNQSALINLTDKGLAGWLEPPFEDGKFQQLGGGNDGSPPPGEPGDNWADRILDGIGLLKTVDVNILCLPATALFDDDAQKSIISRVQRFCYDNRAFYIVDPPKDEARNTVQEIKDWKTSYLDGGSYNAYSALYFPRLTIPNPINQYRLRGVGPSGTVAGVYARTDASRGVWKAPAGTDATLNGASIGYPLTDDNSGELNPYGINALRTFPVYGNVVWGARTLAGADQLSSDYKYIPVRRLTSYIEESLYHGTQWAVFEPNDATLWSSLRLSVDTFMADLARQGAFYRYFITCDGTTTTQSDIDRGICNIIVAFAPVKPAEFIVLQIQQLAGQAAS